MSELLPGEKTGIKTVLQQSFSPADPVPGSQPVEQLPLLPLRKVSSDAAGAESEPAVRGAGRPAGAQNRNTAAWREFLLSKYQSPLIALAEVYSRSISDLAVELGFTSETPGGRKAKPEELFELLKVQMQCAKELAPYVHQKQPMAIDTGNTPLMQLFISSGAATQQQVDKAVGMDINFIDAEPQQNQTLTSDEPQNSVADNSVEVEKDHV